MQSNFSQLMSFVGTSSKRIIHLDEIKYGNSTANLRKQTSDMYQTISTISIRKSNVTNCKVYNKRTAINSYLRFCDGKWDVQDDPSDSFLTCRERKGAFVGHVVMHWRKEGSNSNPCDVMLLTWKTRKLILMNHA